MTILPPAIEFRIFFESDPSTIAPALSHFPITSRIIGSAIRWATISRNHQGGGRRVFPETQRNRFSPPPIARSEAAAGSMSHMGQSRQGRACSKSPHVPYAPKAEVNSEHWQLRDGPLRGLCGLRVPPSSSFKAHPYLVTCLLSPRPRTWTRDTRAPCCCRGRSSPCRRNHISRR